MSLDLFLFVFTLVYFSIGGVLGGSIIVLSTSLTSRTEWGVGFTVFFFWPFMLMPILFYIIPIVMIVIVLSYTTVLVFRAVTG